jgi:diguanylate cyclase (GGDEF)-like protein/PAS domain S-box-containing protein
MVGKIWQAGGKGVIPAAALACLLGIVASPGPVSAAAYVAPSGPAGSWDPDIVREILMGGAAVVFFLTAIILWTMSALRHAQRLQRRNAAFVSSALNSMSQGIVIVDPHGRLAFCNDSYLEMYGLSRSDLFSRITGRQLAELRRARGTLGCAVDDFFSHKDSSESVVTELPDGRAICVKHRMLRGGGMVSLHDDCSAQRDLSNRLANDITEHKSLSLELENTKKFLELVVDNIPVALIVERVSDGRYVLANRSAETVLNRRREDATGLTAVDIFNPKEAKLIVSRDEAAIKKRGVLSEEHPISTKDGLRLFLTRRATVLDEAGEPQYLIKTHEDVTDRRQTESRMAHMAYHDGLTDLPNRAAFLQALSQMIEACEGSKDEFAVLSVDLDGLKEINDVFGHAMGDKLLIEVARRLQMSTGGGVVARLSGDEFGLIIDGPQPEAGKALAERVAASLASDFLIDGKSVTIGATTGISVFPRDGRDGASLLANADAALFRAKAKSRGSISLFEPEMDQQIRDRRALHQDLSAAMKNGELSLHYQPQATTGQNVAGDDVTGFEALARWVHPTRGFVAPSDFIPLAEESGLIVEMGEWILREACREAASWPKPLQIAVNLSPAQFVRGDVVGLVHSILLETGLSPGRLELEITEGILIEDFERGLSLLRRLKALGVCISMDDFGSGYSSLTYLQAFPFDKIKIDRGFVMNLGRNPQSAAIVRAVIGLGHGLHVSIVAEGVETQEQLSFLADEGCDVVQGYFIGKPAPIVRYCALVGRAEDAQGALQGSVQGAVRRTG